MVCRSSQSCPLFWSFGHTRPSSSWLSLPHPKVSTSIYVSRFPRFPDLWLSAAAMPVTYSCLPTDHLVDLALGIPLQWELGKVYTHLSSLIEIPPWPWILAPSPLTTLAFTRPPPQEVSSEMRQPRNAYTRSPHLLSPSSL